MQSANEIISKGISDTKKCHQGSMEAPEAMLVVEIVTASELDGESRCEQRGTTATLPLAMPEDDSASLLLEHEMAKLGYDKDRIVEATAVMKAARAADGASQGADVDAMPAVESAVLRLVAFD